MKSYNIRAKWYLIFTIFTLIVFIPASFCTLSSITATKNNSESLSRTNRTTNTDDIIKKLHSTGAVIIDGETGRTLLGKKEHISLPNASTTKILTCITALEYGNFDEIASTSSYAASMPDVQLNAIKGELFYLNDLLYSLMLKSHNDSAVIIAENVAYNYIFNVANSKITDENNILSNIDTSFLNISDKYNSEIISKLSKEQSQIIVKIFAELMNNKAYSLGCKDTYFITPNGLDASDENGTHSTSPYDLAEIMNYCIKNDTFLKITQTQQKSFSSYKKDSADKITNYKTYSINNSNAFLNMYENIISGKTGFTNDAGYCYVCAFKNDTRSFIVSLLGCGWPGNKSFKWADSKLLLNWARASYFNKTIIEENSSLKKIKVKNGKLEYCHVKPENSFQAVLKNDDKVNTLIKSDTNITAPIKKNDIVGNIEIYINNEFIKSINIISTEDIDKLSYTDYLYRLINILLFK